MFYITQVLGQKKSGATTAFMEAVNEVVPQCPNLGLGLHLNIVEGKTTRANVSKSSRLYLPDGTYHLGFVDLYRERKNKKLLQEIEDDYRDQIERGLKAVSIDHFNSHQHSHAIPEIFEITCRLAKEYGIRYVRLLKERQHYAAPLSRHIHPWYAANLLKFGILNAQRSRNAEIAKRYGVLTNDWFIGITYTGHMDEATFSSGLNAIPKGPCLVESLFHVPKIIASKDDVYLTAALRDYTIDACRSIELATIKKKSILKQIHDQGFKLTNYARLIANDSTEIIPENNFSNEFQEKSKPLSTFVIIDETPFYHPEYVFRLATQCKDLEIKGAAIVKLPQGGLLAKYLLKHWRDLGVYEFFLLGIKQVLVQLWGKFPRLLRGDFDSSVEAVFKRFAIPYRIVSKVNNRNFLNYVEQFSPDIILSSNSLIFGEKLISIPKVACINRHSAVLPACGGILPVFRAIQQGHQFTGATVHHIVKEIDKGPVISRKWLPIFPGDKLVNLYKLCFVLSYEATAESVRMLQFWNSKDLESQNLDDSEIEESYFTYPTTDDWKKFREENGKFI